MALQRGHMIPQGDHMITAGRSHETELKASRLKNSNKERVKKSQKKTLGPNRGLNPGPSAC